MGHPVWQFIKKISPCSDSAGIRTWVGGGKRGMTAGAMGMATGMATVRGGPRGAPIGGPWGT